MSNNKQSSLEWLYNELFPKQIDGFSESEWKIIDKAFEQAKAMHKSEIIWAHGIKMKGVNNHKCVSGEHYYNETFGGNND
jgi:hypothetical protein